MLSLLLLTCAIAADPVEADLVIQNATLVDGSGKPGVVGDLAVKGDRIVGVGKFTIAGSPRKLDGTGLVVAPGFIDLHTHSDSPLLAKATRANLCYAFQGVTTEVTGNCGSGPYDVAKFYADLEKGGIGCNVAHLVPHNDVRSKVMGNVDRAPTADELEKMVALVDKGMQDGAWGLSTGLIYNPGTYSKTDELIALSKPASKHGGIYASHMRDEGSGLLDAINELLRIGKEAELPVHISHIKAAGRKTWGKSADAITLVEKARAAGQKVTADQYPYTASSTSLKAIVVPARFREGKTAEYRARYDDPEIGPKLRTAIEQSVGGRQGGKTLRIASCGHRRDWQGKDLAAIAEAENKPVVDIVVEIEKNGGAQMVSFGMSEEDVVLFMKQPWVATASDGGSKVPDSSVPHPRSYGTFPRKIGRYAIGDSVLPMEQAVRSSSGLPADILRLPERGYLKVGYLADLVVFDPKTFRDTATYDKPHQYAPGVKWLLVNGVAVIEEGKATEKLPGKALKHK